MKNKSLTNGQRKTLFLLLWVSNEKYKYIAVDCDGKIWAFSEKPKRVLFNEKKGIEGGGYWEDVLNEEFIVNNAPMINLLEMGFIDENSKLPITWKDEPMYLPDYDLKYE